MDYAQYSLDAFPMALNEMEEESWSTPEERFKRCFSLRTLEKFGPFFGLIELDEGNSHKFKYLSETYQVRKRPLLDELVQFYIRTVH